MWPFSVEEKKRKTQTPKENGKKGTREKRQRRKSRISQTSLSSQNRSSTITFDRHGPTNRYQYPLRSPLEHAGSIHRHLQIITGNDGRSRRHHHRQKRGRNLILTTQMRLRQPNIPLLSLSWHSLRRRRLADDASRHFPRRHRQRNWPQSTPLTRRRNATSSAAPSTRGRPNLAGGHQSPQTRANDANYTFVCSEYRPGTSCLSMWGHSRRTLCVF